MKSGNPVFLRANAEKYGYDPERFAIWGESQLGVFISDLVALLMMRNLIVFHLSEKIRTILFPVRFR